MPSSKIAALSSPLSIVRSHMHNLSRGEHVVAGFALDHPEDILILSVTDLAARLNVSEATVIRFCQHMGYRGYHEFKICLARDIGREAPKIPAASVR